MEQNRRRCADENHAQALKGVKVAQIETLQKAER